MVTLKSGIILDQHDDGPLKRANGPYPFQIHADYIVLMGLLKFLWALCKIWLVQESLLSILEHNCLEVWIAYIWGPAKNNVHFSRNKVFLQNGLGLSQDYRCQVSNKWNKMPQILPSELLEQKLAVIPANIFCQNTAWNDSRLLNDQCDVNWKRTSNVIYSRF